MPFWDSLPRQNGIPFLRRNIRCALRWRRSIPCFPSTASSAVPEVWGSTYDVRDLLDATVKLRDGKKITDMELGLVEKLALKKILAKIAGTDIEKLLKEYHVI